MRNKLCKLSLLTQADFDDMLAMFADVDAFQYIPKLLNQTEEFYLDYLISSVEKIQTGDAYYWTMRDPDDGEFIGAINLNKIKNTDEMHIGWQICEEYRHQGFAYLGAQMVLDFAINSTEIIAIYGVFDEKNTASDRILNKLRFSLESIWKENEDLIHKYIFQISR